MKIVYSVRSEMGNVRKNNQDNIYADGTIITSADDTSFWLNAVSDTPSIVAVCDGMGGEKNGEKASYMAVERMRENAVRIVCAATKELQHNYVQEYIDGVNSTLNQEFERSGTTLAMAVITDKEICCYNVGDTRIYSMEKKQLVQVTNDHSIYVLSDNCKGKGKRKKLTKCIGIGDCCQADWHRIKNKKMRLLICSDGLYDMLSDGEISDIMQQTTTAADVSDKLIKMALKKGGKDNVTVIVVDIPRQSFIEKIINKF